MLAQALLSYWCSQEIGCTDKSYIASAYCIYHYVPVNVTPNVSPVQQKLKSQCLMHWLFFIFVIDLSEYNQTDWCWSLC